MNRLREICSRCRKFKTLVVMAPVLVVYGFLYYEIAVIQSRKCWTGYIPAVNNFTREKLIPSSVEELSNGFAPSIPDTFLIEKEDYCAKRPHLKAIAYVHSAIRNVEERQTTRETWANASEALGTLFFMGRAKTKEEQKIVDNESRLYGDIVQGEYTDMYKLILYKTLNALFWFSKNCASVKWIVHADDDVIVDVFYLLKVLDKYDRENKTNELFCYLFITPSPLRNGKNKVDVDHYPCRFYPSFCSGPCWFTSSKVVKRLLKNIPKTRFIWVDDVYLTGFVAEIENITRTHVPMIQDPYTIDSGIGYALAWLNVLGNRTKEWQKLVNFYNKN